MNGIFNAGGVVLRVGRVTAAPAAAIELAERAAGGRRARAGAGPARRRASTAS